MQDKAFNENKIVVHATAVLTEHYRPPAGAPNSAKFRGVGEVTQDSGPFLKGSTF